MPAATPRLIDAVVALCIVFAAGRAGAARYTNRLVFAAGQSIALTVRVAFPKDQSVGTLEFLHEVRPCGLLLARLSRWLLRPLPPCRERVSSRWLQLLQRRWLLISRAAPCRSLLGLHCMLGFVNPRSDAHK